MTLLIDPELHTVPTTTGAVFTWDYERSNTPLAKLYEKAKGAQWNADDLPWDVSVDQEALGASVATFRGELGTTAATSTPASEGSPRVSCTPSQPRDEISSSRRGSPSAN